MTQRLLCAGLLLMVPMLLSQVALAQWNEKDEREARETVQEFKAADPGLRRLFDSAYGYAVFPTIGKGGIGIGGAYGEGIVFEQGTAIGTTSVTQFTIGFQFGGQAYSEVVFFETRAALEAFKDGDFKLGAQASAVAATAGASADATFESGVAIFTLVKGGLMYEASVGGQGFSFEPRKGAVTRTVAAAKPSAAASAKKKQTQSSARSSASAADEFRNARAAFKAGKFKDAREGYKRAAEKGHTEALYELGKMYGDGQGVLQDFVSAHAYFNVAGAKGHQQAIQARQMLDGLMSADEKSAARKRATEYWETYGE